MRFLGKMRRAVAGLVAVLAVSCGATAFAFDAKQVELNETTVRNLIASMPEMKTAVEKYEGLDDGELNDANSVAEALMQIQAAGELDSVVQKYGFADMSGWFATMTSVAMAHTFAKEDVDIDAQLQEAIEGIRSNDGMSDEQKQMFIAQIESSFGALKAMQPSQQNIDAVKPFAAELEEFFNDDE